MSSAKMEVKYQRVLDSSSFSQKLTLDDYNMISNLIQKHHLNHQQQQMMSAIASTPDTDNLDTRDTNISIKLVTEEDSDEVIALLKKFFFKDEPLNRYLRLGECKELEKFSVKCIPHACSFKAVNSRNEIIGVILNSVVDREEGTKEPESAAESCEHPKFKKVLSLMDHIDKNFNIFKLCPDVDKIVDVKIMSVDTNYRGLGIGGKLTDRTLEYMNKNEIPLIHVMCSSHFSARVMEKLDFVEVYKLPYTDFVDANGEEVLIPESPHKECRILVKRV